MAKRPYLIAFVALVFISCVAYLFFLIPEQNSRLSEHKDSVDVLPSVNSPSMTLSSEANFPSPVIALQQTLAHGMIEVEKTNLPLLSGELNQFSQTNITEDYASPSELEELKQRLNKLPSSNP